MVSDCTANNELGRISKQAVVSYPCIFLEAMRKRRIASVMIAGTPGRIRTEELPNIGLKCSHYSILLGSTSVTAGKIIKEKLPHSIKTHRGVEVLLHAFSSSVLHGSERLALRLWRYTLEERDAGTHWRPDGPHVRSELYGEEKKSVLSEIEPQFAGWPA
jgi:hypothetical protein